MSQINIFTVPEYMNNFKKLKDFLETLQQHDIDYLLISFEEEFQLVKKECKLFPENIEEINLAIYQRDLEYIAFGLKNIKDKNVGGWPDHIGNENQANRNKKIKDIILNYYENKLG